MLNIGRSQILCLLKSGQLPGSFRITRDWRIPAAAVQAFIAKRQADTSFDMSHVNGKST